MDNYRHRGLRQKLVNTLIDKGIKDEKVLQAIAAIPRHLFLDKAFEEWAYKDIAFPINNNQTISQPFTVAFQTQLLEVQKTDKILEIGTGSGYQSSILSLICKRIYTIERHRTLYEKTTSLLKSIGYYRVRTLYGDGYEGAERYAPFDKILITAGADALPQKLFQQLKIGGYLIIPLGEGEDKTMTRITKTSETEYVDETFGDFKFVPFLKGIT